MYRIPLFIILFGIAIIANGQDALQNVSVETYYISQAEDSSYEDGGELTEGSVTYRVYAELCDSCKLVGFFATPERPFQIASTQNFFNNSDRGEFWGFDIPDNRVTDNTVILDSWLTLGGASDEHWGVEKTADSDGSLVGTEDDDDGVLSGNDPAAGLTLSEADGLVMAENTAPSDFFEFGLTDELKEIFGEFTIGNEFYTESFNANTQEAPVQLSAYDNKVLIGQFTTTGELSFSLNIEVLSQNGELVQLSGSENETAEDGVILSPFLKYPFVCGCTDPYFLEYDPAAACDLEGACVTPAVLGCTDPEACNYDPQVNVNIPELCCFMPDNCEFLNPELICPDWVMNVSETYLFQNEIQVTAYPNPVMDALNLKLVSSKTQRLNLSIYSLDGRLCVNETIELTSGDNSYTVNTSVLEGGNYAVKIYNSEVSESTVITVMN